MHGTLNTRIRDIANQHGCSLGAATQLARCIDDIEAEWKYARDYINDNCIARVPKGSKDLPSRNATGTGYYRWQFYLREALFNPRIIRTIVNDFFGKYGPLLRSGAVQLAGVESASTPLLTAFALEAERAGYPLNVFSIRKEQKAYGRRNWIEGKVLPDVPVLLVDDIISRIHYTMLHALKILKEHDIPTTDHMYCCVYKTPHPQDLIVKDGMSYEVGFMFAMYNFDLCLEDYRCP